MCHANCDRHMKQGEDAKIGHGKNIEILSRREKNRIKEKTCEPERKKESGAKVQRERWKWRWKERCLVNKVLSTTSPGESTLPYPLRLDISLCRSHSLSCCDTRGTRCNHRGDAPETTAAFYPLARLRRISVTFFQSVSPFTFYRF